MLQGSVVHQIQLLHPQHLNKKSGLHRPVCWRQFGQFSLSQSCLMLKDHKQKNWQRLL